MEIYTLNRKFLRQDVVDEFETAIWTERYYGDSEVELVVPATMELIKKLPVGVFLSLNGSNEIMIVETVNIEEGKLKIAGISLLPWLNNRFIRVTDQHKDKTWTIESQVPGQILWTILSNMCVVGSPYLGGSSPISIGVTNPQILAIPGLGLKDYDKSGEKITYAVQYGPVFEAMYTLATAFKIGMTITLESATNTSYSLGFRSYKGLDRTSTQSTVPFLNPVVRFSSQMDSFTDIKELQSLAALKTLIYVFASSVEKPLPGTPGSASRAGSQYIGFDLRAEMILADDIALDNSYYDTSGNPLPGADAVLLNLMTNRAAVELQQKDFIQMVDGEIVPTSQFKYGVHYTLGDIIEVQGNSGVVKTARVTEYIRAQGPGGETSYPTVTML